MPRAATADDGGPDRIREAREAPEEVTFELGHEGQVGVTWIKGEGNTPN